MDVCAPTTTAPVAEPASVATTTSSSSSSDVAAAAADATPAVPEQIIKLLTADGVEFLVPLSDVKKCKSLANTLEDLQDGGEELDFVPIPNVDATCFRAILEFMKQHPNDVYPDPNAPPPKKPKKNKPGKVQYMVTNDLPQWDIDFGHRLKADTTYVPFGQTAAEVDTTKGLLLYHVANAVNFLDYPYMMHILCKWIAEFNIKQATSLQDLRERCGIVSDFTAEEDEENWRNCPWNLED